MDEFHYQSGRLMCEHIPADELLERFGSPLYVYSKATLLGHFDRLARAFAPLRPTICYAMKSCDNIHLLRLLAQRGSGMDVVSGGEVHRARVAGVDMGKVVYAGVGKTDGEIRDAIESGIGWFNIESEAEFENISRIARDMGATAQAALRVNPDVDPETAHAKTTTGRKESKFGVDIDRAHTFFASYGRDEHLLLRGIHLHIGSPVYLTQPYAASVDKALALIEDLRDSGYQITALDLGGGFGADYETGQTPPYEAYAEAVTPRLQPFVDAGGQLLLEPGRTISANAGVLLSTVQYIKKGGSKTFVIVDSGMHHLIRPTLYESWQFIWPTKVVSGHIPDKRLRDMPNEGLAACDVVGPICETGDYLARGRLLPPVHRGDALCVFGAGAYGRVMSSQYNSMPRPAEVLVDGDQAMLIRRRETYDDLLAPEMEAAGVTG